MCIIRDLKVTPTWLTTLLYAFSLLVSHMGMLTESDQEVVGLACETSEQ